MAEIADCYGAVIAVENLPRTCLGNCSKEILELISVDTRLRVCFDTNHLLGEKMETFILAVGNKIITTHVSDYDAINERHWLPGEGVIDWGNLIDALEKVGYKGPWLYEIGFGIPKTILRDRELTCADFARNAKEVFEKGCCGRQRRGCGDGQRSVVSSGDFFPVDPRRQADPAHSRRQ